MTSPYIFDASALVALFRGHAAAFRLLEDADAGRHQVVFPAAAIAEANTYVQAGEAAWEPLLLGRVTCVPLTEHVSITIGSWPRDIPTRHVVFEAQAVRGIVATAEPYRYGPWKLPILAI